MSKSSFTITGIIGWDASRERLESVWYDSNGHHAVTLLRAEGNRLMHDRDHIFKSGSISPHDFEEPKNQTL